MKQFRLFNALLEQVAYKALPYISIGILINGVIFSYGAQIIPQFIGMSYLILGGFCLLDHEEYTKNFKGYDLISRQFGFWPIVVPYLFLILGIGSLFTFFTEWSIILSLVIFASATGGVMRVLIQHKTLPLACLGEKTGLKVTALTLSHYLIFILINFIQILR